MIDLPARMVIEMIAEVFVREVFGTRRKDVIRLILTEGQRFPKLAEIYYHEVIARAVPAVRALMARAVARGELRNDALARFPQLLVAPAMIALVWIGLFARVSPTTERKIRRPTTTMLSAKRNRHDPPPHDPPAPRRPLERRPRPRRPQQRQAPGLTGPDRSEPHLCRTGRGRAHR